MTPATNYTLFPEEKLIELEKDLEAAQVNAGTFLHLFKDKSKPEAVKAAESVRDGEYLFNPLNVIAHNKIYSRLLLTLPEVIDPFKILHSLYCSLAEVMTDE